MSQGIYDDSQVSLRIAVRAAVYTAGMFVIISIFNDLFTTRLYNVWFDVFLKSLSVLIALALTNKRINEGKLLSNPTNIPFLSTFFFYGATLLIVYLAQIGYIVFQIFYGQSGTFIQTIQFLLGIRDFSVQALIAAFITGHIPYIVYYLNLRSRVGRFINSHQK
jgi:hypothetical protein